MAQSMPHEVLDAMDQAELELRGYHSKCYRGLRARGDDLLRYIDQGFASKQSSLETAEEDEQDGDQGQQELIQLKQECQEGNAY
jgi:hypothetical protein